MEQQYAPHTQAVEWGDGELTYVEEWIDMSPRDAQYKVHAIPDPHGDLKAVKQSLRIGGLLDRYGQITSAVEDTRTKLVILGDVLGRGPDQLKILDYLLNFPNVHYTLGNHEIYSFAALLNKTQSEQSKWATRDGQYLAAETRIMYPTEKPVQFLRDQFFNDKYSRFFGDKTAEAATQFDNIYYNHAGVDMHTVDVLQHETHDGLNDLLRAGIANQNVSPFLKDQEYSAPYWKRESGNPPDMLTPIMTEQLRDCGIEYIVRGHDPVPTPRVLHYENGIRSLSIDLRIGSMSGELVTAKESSHCICIADEEGIRVRYSA